MSRQSAARGGPCPVSFCSYYMEACPIKWRRRPYGGMSRAWKTPGRKLASLSIDKESLYFRVGPEVDGPGNRDHKKNACKL